MPNVRVYGRRTNRSQFITSQCFDSDSPEKTLLQPEPRNGLDASRKTVDSYLHQSLLQNNEFLKDGSESISAIADGLSILQLDNPKAVEERQSFPDKSVLEVRDVNTVTRPRPRPRKIYKPRKNRNETITGANVRILQHHPAPKSPKNLEPSRVDIKTVLESSTSSTEVLSTTNLPASPKEPRTRQAPLQTLPPQIQASPVLTSYISPLLALCTDPGARTAAKSFQTWADSLAAHFTISKIAEASYGEVYRLSLKCPTPGFTKADESVLKVLSLRPPPPVSPSQNESGKLAFMSAIEDVASEVRLLQLMSPVPGWTRFRDVSVLQGRVPRQFVNAWKHYNKTVKRSHFPDPARKKSYDEDQLWAVVEMQDAGTDLETLIEKDDEVMRSAATVWDVFWGVACTVAKGEEWAQFEHRDLHLGNICVRPEQPSCPSAGTQYNSVTELRTGKCKLGTTNLETTIIDYTLSRASLVDHEPDSAEEVAFFDLAKDPAIFQGNGADDYQYDIYRYMKSAVDYGNPAVVRDARKQEKKKRQRRKKPLESNEAASPMQDGSLSPSQLREGYSGKEEKEGIWRQHHPLTNLVWLHFVLHTLMKHLNSTPIPSSSTKALSIKSQVSSPVTASPPLTPLAYPSVHDRLTLLNQKLAITNLKHSEFRSAVDLVAWAVREGWLDEEDVIGCDDEEITEVAKTCEGLAFVPQVDEYAFLGAVDYGETSRSRGKA